MVEPRSRKCCKRKNNYIERGLVRKIQKTENNTRKQIEKSRKNEEWNRTCDQIDNYIRSTKSGEA